MPREIELSVWYAVFMACLCLPALRTQQHKSMSHLLKPLAIRPAVGACVGGWCGAYFVVLDWDQHWQVFPVAPLFWSCIGYLAGIFVAISPLWSCMFGSRTKKG